MATSLNVIRTLTMVAKALGFQEAAASADKLSASQEKLVGSSEKVEKATLAQEQALLKTLKQIDPTVRAQENIRRVQEQLDRSRQQGLISQQEQSRLMQQAVAHFNRAGDAAQKHGIALKGLQAAQSEVSASATQMAGTIGVAGRVLTALGPIGLAIGAALGVVAGQFAVALKSGLELADLSGKLVDLSDSVGLTVDQLQVLERAGAQVGLSNEQTTTALEKFTASLGSLRESSKGAIKAFDELGGPGFAQLVANAKSVEEALGLVLKQLTKVDEAQRAASSKAIFGRGGIGVGRLAGVVEEGGGLEKFTADMAKANALTGEQARKWDELGDRIRENLKLAKENILVAFGAQNLPFFDLVSEGILKLAQEFRRLIELAGGFKLPFQDTILNGLEKITDKLREFNDNFTTPDLSGFQRALETLIPPQAVAAIIEFIRLIQLLLSLMASVPGTALSIAASLATFDFAGAKATAAAFASDLPDRLRDIKDQAGELAKTFKSDFVPQLDNAGKKAATTTAELEASETGIKGVGTQAAETTNKVGQLNPKLLDLGSSADKAAKQTKTLGDQLGQAAGQFIGTFVNGLVDGKNATEALATALQGLGKQLISIGTQDIGKQLATSLNSILPSLGGFGLGGLATIGIGAGISLIGRLFGGSNKEAEEAARRQAEELQKAKDAWAAMTTQLEDFNRAAAGLIKGELRTNLQDLEAQRQPLAAAAIKAQNFSALAQIQETFFRGQARLLDEFVKSLPALHNMLTSEGGLQGATATTIASVKAFRDSILGLKDSLDEANTVTNTSDFDQVWSQFANEAQHAALAMLDQTKQQSDLIVEYNRVTTVAGELQAVLVELGMSAEDAAAAIEERLGQAIDKLRGKFIDDLTRQVNKLAGGDWINQVNDLVAQVAQLRADAMALGISTTLIDTFYALSAADIIRQNKLVGNSLEIVARMTGFTAEHLQDLAKAAEEAGNSIKRTVEEINQAIQNNEDRLFLALHRSDSLADQLARFDLAAQREREAEIAAGGEAIASLEAALAQERINIITDFNDEQARLAKENADKVIEENKRIAEENARILEEAADFIQQQVRRINDWIANFLAGPQSTLPPSQQLAQAQSNFASEMSLAASGNRDALSNITSAAQTLVDATRRYYGSSATGQGIISNLITQLRGLPSQLTPEEFIVGELKPPIEDIPGTIDDQTTTLAALLNNLKLAVESGDAQAIAIALLPLFDQLDTTMDQALSFAEFQAGLGATYSAGTLRGIFNELDGNGNGLLEKSELIKIATQGTKTGVDGVDTKTATNNQLLQQLIAINTTGGAMYDIAIHTFEGISNINSHVQAYLQYLPYLAQIAAWAPGSSHAMGGLLGGPRHSAGGIPIVAEGGEYIMSRAAVSRYGVGTMDAMNFGGAANDNIFSAIRGLERSLLRGLKALVETQLEAAGVMAQPLKEANKLSRTRRGEKKTA